MGDFKQNRGKRFGRGQGGRSGNRDRGSVTMHQAVCDQCGNSCEVPFRPTDGKPVYCSTCFGSKRNSGSSRGSDRYQSKSYNTFTKPDHRSNVSKENNDELKKQLVTLNAKMDQLIKVVEAVANTKSLMVEKKAKKSVKKVLATKVKKVAKKTKK